MYGTFKRKNERQRCFAKVHVIILKYIRINFFIENLFYRFPNRPDVLVPYEQLNDRMKVLEDYLGNLIKMDIYKHHPETVCKNNYNVYCELKKKKLLPYLRFLDQLYGIIISVIYR